MNRKINLDYLRITACIMVILVHLSAQFFYVVEVESSTWGVLNFYDCLGRSSVALFVMISGYLFLAGDKEIPLKQLFSGNILKLFVVYVFWSLFYAVDAVGLSHITDFKQILGYTIYAEFHLWYLPALLGIYCLYPLFRSIIKYKDGKYFKYACIFFMIICFLQSKLPYVSDGTFVSNFLYGLAYLSGYFLLGYGLGRYRDKFNKIRSWQLLLIFVLMFVAAAACNWSYGIGNSINSTLFYNESNIFVFAEACSLFLLFLRISQVRLSDKHKERIIKISKNTLLVYVLHVFVLYHLNSWFNVNSLTLPPVVMVPLLAIAIFVICQLAALVLEKIPVFNRWLM